MAYSNDSDLLLVLPNASGYITDDEGQDADFSGHRTWATNLIDSRLRGRTAVPVGTGDSIVNSMLSNVEANLTAYSLVKANFTKFDTEGADEAFKQFKKEGTDALDNLYFPASFSTPAQATGFIGNGTIAVTVRDDYAYTSNVIVRCTTGGTSPIFGVTDLRTGQAWSYEVANDNQWPSEEHIQTATAKSLVKHATIVITDGATPFTQGDTWLFRIYTNYKKTRKGRIGFLQRY